MWFSLWRYFYRSTLYIYIILLMIWLILTACQLVFVILFFGYCIYSTWTFIFFVAVVLNFEFKESWLVVLNTKNSKQNLLDWILIGLTTRFQRTWQWRGTPHTSEIENFCFTIKYSLISYLRHFLFRGEFYPNTRDTVSVFWTSPTGCILYIWPIYIYIYIYIYINKTWF